MLLQTFQQHGNIRHGGELQQQVAADSENVRYQCEDVGAAILQQEYLASGGGTACRVHVDQVGVEFFQCLPEICRPFRLAGLFDAET